jgi:serine/threonine protein kinase
MTEIPQHLTEALAGRYEPIREIGRGGMATVYLARDVRHGRDVAVKVLKSELRESLGVDRFLREIDIAAQLTHPHVLPLLDSGDREGVLHYVMPHIEGSSLRELLLREGRLDLRRATELTREVASALHYAHRRGVIHRDIKPENILLSDGHAVVADFGIAKAVVSAGGVGITRTGFPLGTPGYMSPEQAAGKSDLDERSDVYSLACVVYEMLAGSVPAMWVTEEDARMLRFIDAPEDQRAVLDRLPGAVEQVLVVAMAMRPAQRFKSAQRFSDALERALTGEDVVSDASARRIIQRAAELQEQQDAEMESFSIPGLQRIGAEVDISPGHVQRAANEMVTRTEPKKGGIFGLLSKVELEQSVDGEIPEGLYEDLLEEVRAVMGEVGRINPTLGKSLSWNSLSFQNSMEGTGRLMHVMVAPKGGKTRIRITESSGAAAAVTTGMLGAGGVLAMAFIENLLPTGIGPGGPVVVIGVMAGAYVIARMGFQWFVRRRYRVLRGLMDSLTQMVRDHRVTPEPVSS